MNRQTPVAISPSHTLWPLHLILSFPTGVPGKLYCVLHKLNINRCYWCSCMGTGLFQCNINSNVNCQSEIKSLYGNGILNNVHKQFFSLHRCHCYHFLQSRFLLLHLLPLLPFQDPPTVLYLKLLSFHVQ